VTGISDTQSNPISRFVSKNEEEEEEEEEEEMMLIMRLRWII